MLIAEWAPQKAVLMAWPDHHTDWSGMLLEVQACYKTIIQEILKEEEVWLLCRDQSKTYEALGIHHKNLILIIANYNDTWTRDYGPISFSTDLKKVNHLDFGFNGWGKKFDSTADNQINRLLHQQGYLENLENHQQFILEGGSIETDGEGILLSTSHCLLAPNRNQPMTLDEIEIYLTKELGISHFLWLNNGYLAGDDTDSHIDTLARFCNENTICYVKTNDKEDEHFFSLNKMEQQIQSFKNKHGKSYQLIDLPMPSPIYDQHRNRLPATYANFLILNDRVLVPIYNDPNDHLALTNLQQAFPEKELIGIDCNSLIKQHGSLHCITMQIPK